MRLHLPGVTGGLIAYHPRTKKVAYFGRDTAAACITSRVLETTLHRLAAAMPRIMRGMPRLLGGRERVAFSPPPGSAYMRNPTERDSHDQTITLDAQRDSCEAQITS